MKKIELLAPAGNIECLRVAVNNGADAVYIGLPKFNARINANNFKINELKNIVKYCHEHNAKLYVTLNTLIKNDEINDFFNYLFVIEKTNVDAIIITHQSFIPLIKKYFPKLKIHLSTQSGLFNTYSILEKVDRVILPRELSKEEIKNISKKIETEIFVHGALCISLSGKCLFSSIVGKRSGNRGLCAQPCRKIYNQKYLLSTKDLCLIEEISTIINLGVKSLKIEGRMKNAYYVQETVKAYRNAIDDYYNNQKKNYIKKIDELKTVFNRDFTKGFMFEENLISDKIPCNRGILIGKTKKKGKIILNNVLKIGDGIGIIQNNLMTGFKIKSIKKNNKNIEFAKNNDEVIINDLIFEENLEVYKTSIENKKLNLGKEIKFDNIIELFEKINYLEKIKKDFINYNGIKNKDKIPNNNNYNHKNNYYNNINNNENKNNRINNNNKNNYNFFIKVKSFKDGIDADKKKVKVIYYDILKDDFFELKQKLKNSKLYGYINGPLNDEEIDKIYFLILKYEIEGILTEDIGFINYIYEKKLNIDIHMHYSLNVFNDIDINYYLIKYNATSIISLELSIDELKKIENKNLLAFVHGEINLMKIKNKFKINLLTDDENRKFKLIKENNYYNLLNNKKLGLFNQIKLYKNNNINNYYIESEGNSGKILSIYKNILENKFDDKKIKKNYTKGWFDKGAI
jgi:collagenase-like PrtC family protease